MAVATRAKAAASARKAAPPPPPPPQQAAPMVAPPVTPLVGPQPPPGRAVALDRDGNPIWRHTPQGGTDPFAIDPVIMPAGWVYEWKRYSVMNQPDHTYHAKLHRSGWRPVHADKHDGVFLPPGTTGSIIVDGLILMEIPVALYGEAKQDEKRAADDVMRKARTERGLQIPQGTQGVTTGTAAAQGATFINVTRAFASAEDKEALASIPRPAYPREDNTID